MSKLIFKRAQVMCFGTCYEYGYIDCYDLHLYVTIFLDGVPHKALCIFDDAAIDVLIFGNGGRDAEA